MSLCAKCWETPCICGHALLTTVEAAAFLRLSKITLEKWRRRAGQGPQFVRLGGKVFYRRERLEEFIAARESKP